ncbi:hypothetical protein [Wenxinia marina]|uniref:Uncharacterized protein n=1 Tax=Wenxinia marina DSM 24838 TaxID=1123501 RepID=A0A0D0QCD5_9RHOB|nr:hypothetical protein [Wenxinia marina]KIQ69987.1 hypothetical protein Wenmar_01557 [Wenxinia marina DSM 24838]GGL62687.1 hypothetical protein GCM10011392_16620 [Wenxinia marina]
MRLTVLTAALLALTAAPALAQKGSPAPTATPPAVDTPTPPPVPQGAGINFGDDSGEYPNDGECDDRRFAGAGVAASYLNWDNTGGDATDCRSLVDSGQARLYDHTAATQAMQCGTVDFGDDSGEYPNDGECDDIRFEGFGMAYALSEQLIGKDASDCRQLCQFGMIGMR